ncbi:hypothetical protein AB6Q13_19130 [Ralstonia solanacearum]|uniref:hypothetical protein n=1 Tax=Ralstonia solanacearum TaxID=305 RepID=UPI001FF762E3|nr:hypothetical protein [Ralstonia solanacearum]MDB0568084.1 hypothetical protein [Ralstonia solanacearum]MDB0578118.1 hypothetical protein [Ralstonia solanacearum]
MTLFHYPKTRHTRTLKPRQFKRYQTYKRYLQTEFSRVCVYCRQPDSGARNINMQVDHYRPKSHPRFGGLICAYKNLYYCCAECNTFKSNYWPADEKKEPFIVNPCDFAMASHLRYNSKTCEVEVHNNSRHGEWTIELLKLNDDVVVRYRQLTQATIAALDFSIKAELAELATLKAELAGGEISQAEYDADATEIMSKLEDYRRARASYCGETPLPKLKTQRFNVPLTT